MKGPVITLLLRLHDDVERAGLFFGYFLASIQQGRLTGLRIANASWLISSLASGHSGAHTPPILLCDPLPEVHRRETSGPFSKDRTSIHLCRSVLSVHYVQCPVWSGLWEESSKHSWFQPHSPLPFSSLGISTYLPKSFLPYILGIWIIISASWNGSQDKMMRKMYAKNSIFPAYQGSIRNGLL